MLATISALEIELLALGTSKTIDISFLTSYKAENLALLLLLEVEAHAVSNIINMLIIITFIFIVISIFYLLK